MFKGRQWMRWLAAAAVVAALSAGAVGVVSAHGGPGWLGRGGIDRQALLAEELGITVEKLQSAQEAARARALEQALEQGLITQEQYDRMQLHALLQPYLDKQALLAAALGVEPEALGAKPLQTWLEELDLDRAALQERLQAAYEAALAQAVKDGVITQEQADTLKDEAILGPGRGMRPFMGPRGRGGFGMRGGNCPQLDDESGLLQNNSLRLWRMGSAKRF